MTSNWMRFVNCARCEDEQNLTAFQFMGEIYYKTLRPVSRGDELLVWYGEEYAKDLGICSSESKRKENLSKRDAIGSPSEVLSSPKDLGVCQSECIDVVVVLIPDFSKNCIYKETKSMIYFEFPSKGHKR